MTYDLAIPVSPGKFLSLLVSVPLTEDEWTQMLAVLDAMKPGIVPAPVAEPSP